MSKEKNHLFCLKTMLNHFREQRARQKQSKQDENSSNDHSESIKVKPFQL